MLTDEERKQLQQEGWFMASDGWRKPIIKVVAKQATCSEKIAAEEEAQQRGCRGERRRRERRREQLLKVEYARGWTMEQALERIAKKRERRSKQMDVLDTLDACENNMVVKKDACVKENNMALKKNSKKKMDVAKEENGEMLIK